VHLAPKPLDKASIATGMKDHWIGSSLVVLDDCTSTNDVIERSAIDGAPHGAVVIAETQHAGRGRRGRTWYSPRGGVWLSILVRSQGFDRVVDSLPVIGVLATAKVLALNLRVKAGVRWPNDVVVGNRKIAGVLVESKSRGNQLSYAALGLGINANFQTRQIESIRDSSTSLLELVGSPINREQLIVSVLSEVEGMYDSVKTIGETALIETLKGLDWSRGKQVMVKTADRDIIGQFEDYQSLAKVRIRTGNGFEEIETNTVISVDYESD